MMRGLGSGMKKLLAQAAVFLSLFCFSPAFAAPAFYGTWSCAQIIDSIVDTKDWSREVYSADGVSAGPEGKPAPLKVRVIRKGVYDLGYADGARARVSMKEPWMFIRGTMEHSYLCLRAAQ